jgi:hypothetical protein
VGGHIDYVQYMFTHWSVPPAQGGWEFYQPPLYYFLSALWMQAGQLLGRPLSVLGDGLRLRGALVLRHERSKLCNVVEAHLTCKGP